MLLLIFNVFNLSLLLIDRIDKNLAILQVKVSFEAPLRYAAISTVNKFPSALHLRRPPLSLICVPDSPFITAVPLHVILLERSNIGRSVSEGCSTLLSMTLVPVPVALIFSEHSISVTLGTVQLKTVSVPHKLDRLFLLFVSWALLLNSSGFSVQIGYFTKVGRAVGPELVAFELAKIHIGWS